MTGNLATTHRFSLLRLIFFPCICIDLHNINGYVNTIMFS